MAIVTYDRAELDAGRASKKGVSHDGYSDTERDWSQVFGTLTNRRTLLRGSAIGIAA